MIDGCASASTDLDKLVEQLNTVQLLNNDKEIEDYLVWAEQHPQVAITRLPLTCLKRYFELTPVSSTVAEKTSDASALCQAGAASARNGQGVEQQKKSKKDKKNKAETDTLDTIMTDFADSVVQSIEVPVLYDLRVKPAKYGPDDTTYDGDAQLRCKMPRGCSVIRWPVQMSARQTADAEPIQLPRLTMALSGLRKFTGMHHVDDDDRIQEGSDPKPDTASSASAVGVVGSRAKANVADAQSGELESLGAGGDVTLGSSLPSNVTPWHLYFTEPIESARRVVSLKKLNGELLLLSCHRLPPDANLMATESGSLDEAPASSWNFVTVVGSKNVHLAYVDPADIDSYSTTNRCGIAITFAHAFENSLAMMSATVKRRLYSFMADNSLTAVFEILQPLHQHVENLWYIKQNTLIFVTWVSNNLNTLGLTAGPPDVCINIARNLQLQTAKFTNLLIGDVDKHLDEVRATYGEEGVVLYYLNNEQRTIGVVKQKTIWYIICRAIREKTKGAAHYNTKKPSYFSISKYQESLRVRLFEIKTWLGLTEKVFENWCQLGIEFMRFAVLEENEPSESMLDAFPVIWWRFLCKRNFGDIGADYGNRLSGSSEDAVNKRHVLSIRCPDGGRLQKQLRAEEGKQ